MLGTFITIDNAGVSSTLNYSNSFFADISPLVYLVIGILLVAAVVGIIMSFFHK